MCDVFGEILVVCFSRKWHMVAVINKRKQKRLNPHREIWILLYKHKHHSYAAAVLTRVENLSKKTHI